MVTSELEYYLLLDTLVKDLASFLDIAEKQIDIQKIRHDETYKLLESQSRFWKAFSEFMRVLTSEALIMLPSDLPKAPE